MKNWKKALKQISDDSQKVDTKALAHEVIAWLTANVESYLDNSVKMFKIDLIVDESESMKTVKKLQDLYHALPSVDEEDEIAKSEGGNKIIDLITETKATLDVVTKQAWDDMRDAEDELRQLFKRLSFYYELKGFKQGKPLIQELDGCIDVINFEYENFSMGITVKKGMDRQNQDGTVDEENKGEKKVIREYIIPEGFTCWIEITHRPVQRPTAMF